MPFIETTDFGRLDYAETDTFDFPAGLPGFEASHRFLLLTPPLVDPFCFLQSVEDGHLRFICLPAECVRAGYELTLSAEEAALLGCEPGVCNSSTPEFTLLCVVTVPSEGTPTANLLAPMVLAHQTRRGAQCIRPESGLGVDERLLVRFRASDSEQADRAGEAG